MKKTESQKRSLGGQKFLNMRLEQLWKKGRGKVSGMRPSEK